MKFVLSFLCLFLIVTNSVLLLFQYDAYSSGLEENGQVFFYEQDVEMKVKRIILLLNNILSIFLRKKLL